jgi:hypothetical protein
MTQKYKFPTTQPTSSPSSDQQKISDNDESLITNNSGPTPPTVTVAGMHWFDTTNYILYVRDSSNSRWGVCSNLYNGTIQTNGSFTVDATYNKSLVLVQSTPTITLPSASDFIDFNVEFFIFDNSAVTIIPDPADNGIYRDGAILSSITIPANNSNTYLKIGRWAGDPRWFLAGNPKGVDSDLSTLTNVGKKAILDLIHPIGSIYTTFTNTAPPLNGILGVSWAALAEGYAVMTGNTSNTGSAGGGNRLDTGVTTGHSLTQAELPAASVSVAGSVTGTVAISQRTLSQGDLLQPADYMVSGGATAISGTFSGSGTVNGSNAAHTHPLNVFNYKLLMYRRIS